MYPPNYDLRGVQIVHDRHLKELRQEAEAYHFAQEIKQGESVGEAAQPTWFARMITPVERLLARISMRGDQRAPRAKRARRTGFNNG